MNYFLIALVGLVGGIGSGLFGVGGGAIFVPLLILLCRLDAHVAIGTSLAVIVPTAIVALVTHHGGGMVNWRFAACLAVLAVIGAWLGARLSLQTDAALLRRLFALLLIGISLKLFFMKS